MNDRGPVTIGGHCASCEHFSADHRGPYHTCNLLRLEAGPAFAVGPLHSGPLENDQLFIAVKAEFGCTQWFPASEEALAERDVKVAW